MHKLLLGHVVNYVDEEDFFLEDLSPRIDHGNND